MATSILYGLLNQKDLAGDLTPQNLAIEIDRDLMVVQVGETVGQHNAEVSALRGLFASDTTDYTLSYQGALSNDLQEGDEYTDPDPVKGAAYYSVGFPLRDAYTAWGANWLTLEQMTLKEFSDRTDQMLTGDINWHRKWIFGTMLFDGTNGSGAPGTQPFVFNDPKYGNLNVYGLANGDSATYEKYGSSSPATDNHYTAQNGAISDTAGQNPFPNIETALLEHPSNTGPVLSLINPALTTSVSGLANFVKAPAFAPLANPGPGSTGATFAGNLPFALPPAARVIGEIGNVIVAEWRSVPTGIIMSRVQSVAPPLLFRQRPQVRLQGFGPIGFANGEFGNPFPYYNQKWYRGGGFGAYNRVAAHVHQVGSSTTYAMPSAYYPLFGRSS